MKRPAEAVRKLWKFRTFSAGVPGFSASVLAMGRGMSRVLVDVEELAVLLSRQRGPLLVRGEAVDTGGDLLEGRRLLDHEQPVTVSEATHDVQRLLAKLLDCRRVLLGCGKFNDNSQWKLLSIDYAKNGYNIIIA